MLFPAESIAVAQPPSTAIISGLVVDARSGLPIAAAHVHVSGPQTADTTTDSNGTFVLSNLVAGTYRVSVDDALFQAVASDDILVVPGGQKNLTIALSAAGGVAAPHTIGRVSTSSSSALAKSSIISKDVQPEQIQQLGYFRAADLIRTLPQVNRSSNSETSAPGDSYAFDIRGIGMLETTTLFDGHPLGYGVPGGYNFQVSPTFGLRNIQVAYGSGGSDLSGVDAIGGVIDMQTVEPTRTPQATLTQGFGTFQKLATTFVGTGTTPNGRTGYALALGLQTIDGPYHQNQYQPGAAFDQSAPVGSPVYNLGSYKLDTAVDNRALVAKVRQQIGGDARLTHLSATVFDTHYHIDKTGNGDLDYLPYDVALQNGQSLLSNYSPPAPADISPMNPSCPAGTFLATNANGSPNGFGPDGNPDGGTPCQTPRQYAKFNTGLQGVGPASQDFTVSDYHLGFDTLIGNHQIAADVFTNRYATTNDRRNSLPFNAVTGDAGSWSTIQVSTTGAQAVDNVAGAKNDVGFGTLWFNNAYLFQNRGVQQPSPIDHNTSFFFRDVYHPVAEFRLFLDVNYKFASITNAWYLDPRIAAVISPTRNDAIRLAYGLASSQPQATYTYLPISVGAFDANLSCGNFNPIGSGLNPSAHPERGTDLEASFGHRFRQDSQIQATFYSENVFNKLQSALVPLSATGTTFIDPATLATFQKKFVAQCGAAVDPLSSLALVTNINLGHLAARGFDISGRARASKRFYLDYDYSESTVESVGATTRNIPPGQLANVPLHKASLAADQTLPFGLDVRLTGYFVSVNNPKNAPGYAYADLALGMPFGHGTFDVALTNVFSSHAGAFGYINHGIPGPDGSPQELFLLPYRSLYVSYAQKIGGRP
jgi:hypothetical protein